MHHEIRSADPPVYAPVIRDFMRFTSITNQQAFRTVTRAHVFAWRDDLHRRNLAAATIRHHLASLSSLFDYLCEKNAVLKKLLS